jgi:thiamine kinase-like enzyme
MSTPLFSLLTPDQVPVVEKALHEAFGSSTLTAAAPLTGGLSASAVYKIMVQDQNYVLKLDRPSAYSARTSFENLLLASAAGIAPPVYYHDAAGGVSISGYIEVRPVQDAWPADQLVNQLAGTLKAIHSLPYTGTATDLKATIDTMISRFQQSGMLWGPAFSECFELYEKIRYSYPWHDTGKVFSHNDLNPNNILCDGKRIWVVDWDVASLNDRYIDLANVANYFVHAPEQQKAFLHAYFGHAADARQTACFHIMRQVCRIIYALLMFQLAAQGRPAGFAHHQDMEGFNLQTFGALMGKGQLSLATYEGQLFYGKALLNEAVQQMRQPYFQEALAVLEQQQESANGI